MASYLIQAGTALYRMTQAGVATAITLPSDVTLFGSGTPSRAVLFNTPALGQQPIIVVVNGGTHDLWIDSAGVARALQLSPPVAAPTLAVGSGTGLTGVYKVAVTFKIKDILTGQTLMESGLGPISSGSASLVNQTLRANNIPVSGNFAVNARGLYRTLSGGSVFYPWFDLDDNTTLSDDRGVADSLLSILPTTATTYAAPPDLKLCISWKDRLWGVPRLNPDTFQWSEERVFYAWAVANQAVAPPRNMDAFGITAFIPRRDDLGVCRRKRLYKIIGSGNSSFQRVGISEEIGCVSQESVVVRRNVAYFLSERGVAEWTDQGVRLVSEAQVDAWFTTDTYFNRSLFGSAQGRYNPDTDAYELLLANAGSSNLDRWVSFHLKTRQWYGPHKTDAFTPTCVATTSSLKGTLTASNNLPITVLGGSDGYLYKRDSSNVNDNATAVALSVGLPPLNGQEPDFDKFWDRPTIHTRAESAGGNLVVSPQVGDLNCAADSPIVHDLTQDRETLPILGVGRYAQLTLTHSSTTEQPRIYGIEVPYTILGRR